MLRARPGHHRLPRCRAAPPVPGGLGSALGLLAGTLTALLAAAGGVRGHPVVGLVLLGGTALAVTAVTSAPGALAGAAQCWALWDGFLVNRYGELTLTRVSALALIALLVAAAGVAWTARRLRTRPLDARRLLAPEPTIRPTAPPRRRPSRRLSPRVAHRASPGR